MQVHPVLGRAFYCIRKEMILRLNFEFQSLVEGWIIHSGAFAKAHAVDQFARYAPDIGWRAIMAIVASQNALRHVGSISHALGMLISKFGDLYIARIEIEAQRNEVFRACLADVRPNPTFPLPRHLWQRLSRAAGVSLGPMSPGMQALYERMPQLAHVSTVDLNPLDTFAVPQLSDPELHEHVEAFFNYHDTFWTWEELERRVREDPPAAWRLILKIVEQGADAALCGLGEGALEDLIENNAADFIERVEEQAALHRRFRFCLSHVWQATMPLAIWDRIVAARADEPQRG